MLSTLYGFTFIGIHVLVKENPTAKMFLGLWGYVEEYQGYSKDLKNCHKS